jgi:hypothetical protein
MYNGHDITEILLKVTLNTIIITQNLLKHRVVPFVMGSNVHKYHQHELLT